MVQDRRRDDVARRLAGVRLQSPHPVLGGGRTRSRARSSGTAARGTSWSGGPISVTPSAGSTTPGPRRRRWNRICCSMPSRHSTTTTSSIRFRASRPSMASILKMPYWHRVYVQRVPSEIDGGERLLITFGNAFPVPADPKVPPRMSKSSTRPTNASSYRCHTRRRSSAHHSTGSGKGPFCSFRWLYLDIGMNVQSVSAFMPDFTSDPKQPPFAFIKDGENLGPNISRSVLIDAAFVDLSGLSQSGDRRPIGMITHVAPDARVLAVKNQVGWFAFDNSDESFLMVPRNVAVQGHRGHPEDRDRQDPRETARPGKGGRGRLPDHFLHGLFGQAGRSETAGVRLHANDHKRGRASRPDHDLERHQRAAVDQDAGSAGGRPRSISRGSIPTARKPPNVQPAAKAITAGQCDFDGAYRPYFDEIFFQIPFFIATQLSANQHHRGRQGLVRLHLRSGRRVESGAPPAGNPDSV